MRVEVEVEVRVDTVLDEDRHDGVPVLRTLLPLRQLLEVVLPSQVAEVRARRELILTDILVQEPLRDVRCDASCLSPVCRILEVRVELGAAEHLHGHLAQLLRRELIRAAEPLDDADRAAPREIVVAPHVGLHHQAGDATLLRTDLRVVGLEAAERRLASIVVDDPEESCQGEPFRGLRVTRFVDRDRAHQESSVLCCMLEAYSVLMVFCHIITT